MEYAPATEVSVNLCKQRGELHISGNVVKWMRYGYVYRQFTMENPVRAAVFAQYANTTKPQELWVAIVCEDRMLHSFGITSGKSHTVGLKTLPKALLACGSQGVVLATTDEQPHHSKIQILQGPEELVKNIVPSSVSAPLRSDDKLVFCDDHTLIVWNPVQHSVRACSLRFLNKGSQMNQISAMDGYSKAAMFSPIREWPQADIGKIFSQTLTRLRSAPASGENFDEMGLVAIHDPSSYCLYVLCGPDLLRHEDIVDVSPVLGIHKLPGIVTVSGNELQFSCLFFPQLNPLRIETGIESNILRIKSDAESNWIQIEYKDDGMDSHSRVAHFALKLAIDSVVKTCFDIVLELWGPTELAAWLAVFLAQKARASSDMRAFALTLSQFSKVLDPSTVSRLIIYLHMLKEELGCLVIHQNQRKELASAVYPYIRCWGDSWVDAYTDAIELEDLDRDSIPQADTTLSSPASISSAASSAALPSLLEFPPNIFAALASCMESGGEGVLPEFLNKPQFYPVSISLIAAFQTVSVVSDPEQVRTYLMANEFPEQIDRFSPGLRTCLLEIMAFVGIDPYTRTPASDRASNSSGAVTASRCTKLRSNRHAVSEAEFAERSERLIRGLFPRDLRYNEALRLLNVKSPQSCLFGLFYSPKTVAEHKFAKIQKEWGEALADRAMATAYGRAAINLNSKRPLLWEQVDAPIVEFSGECAETGISIPPLYKSLKAAAEHDNWGVFAHGAALGLSVSPDSPGIDSLWVITSAQLNSTSTDIYSGFVYGLGLSGHLATLEDWHFYESLVSSNTRGTLAALLGVAASKRGSRDAKLTKVLSVHIRALLPLEVHKTHFVPPELERAALVSLGLLYLGQGVRHLTEALVRELERDPSRGPSAQGEYSYMNGENSENNEAHNLAVGLALGLINCGWGKSSGLAQLLPIITGLHDRSVYAAESVNGALCAILLSFVGTKDSIISAQIRLPHTRTAAEYSAPNVFFARALTYHLIEWDGIGHSAEWVLANIPAELKAGGRSAQFAKGTDDATRIDELWYYYSLAGVLAAMAMRHVSSNNEKVISTILQITENEIYAKYKEYLVQLVKNQDTTNENSGGRNKGLDYDLMQTTKHFAQLLSSLALAVSAVAAGSGNLAVLRMLRKLWQITPQVQAQVSQASTPSETYLDVGIDLTSVAQAIGWLFMCGAQRSFKTDPKSVGFLAIFTFLDVLGGASIAFEEWQHLRFFWSLLTEQRCLYARHDPAENVRVEIELESGQLLVKHLPLMLPSLSDVRCIQVVDPKYSPQLVRGEDLSNVLVSGLNVSAKETSRHSLESMLPSTKAATVWDRLPIQGLRASLQALVSEPASIAEDEDVKFALFFEEMWPVDSDSRLLKRRDIEQIKFLRWYSHYKRDQQLN